MLSLPSQHVIYGTLSTVFCIAGAWIYSHGSDGLKTIFIETSSWLVLINEILFQINMIYYGSWSVRTSLPFEMCYISAILIPLYSRNRNSRLLKNWFYFAGFAGSFFAFLNTNLSEMSQIYISIHYFFAHGLVVFVMFTIVIDGFRPTWQDFFQAVQLTSLLVVIMFGINIIFDSNYMFTFQKPEGVNFTALMPDWPYYFIIMLIIGLIFYLILMLITFIPFFKRVSNNVIKKY